MKANLSLVLDEKCEIRLDLLKDIELEEIDKYTTTKNNSQEIREEYIDIIKKYLELNKNYISSFKTESSKKGSIVITYKDQNNLIKRMRVLYKDNIIKIDSKQHYKRVYKTIKKLNDVHKTYDIINHFRNNIFSSEFHQKKLNYAYKLISNMNYSNEEQIKKMNDKQNNELLLLIKNLFSYVYDVDKSDKMKKNAYFNLRLIDSYLEKNYTNSSKRENKKQNIKNIKINKDNISQEKQKVVKTNYYSNFQFFIEDDGQYSFIDKNKIKKLDHSYKEPYEYDREGCMHNERR